MHARKSALWGWVSFLAQRAKHLQVTNLVGGAPFFSRFIVLALPRYDRLRMIQYQIQFLGCRTADVTDSTFHFLGGTTPPVRGGWALLPE